MRRKINLREKIETTNWILLVSLTLASLIFLPARFTWGITLGGLISLLNFVRLRHDLQIFFHDQGSRRKGKLIFKYYLRLTLSGALLYVLISRDLVNIFGLLIGLSLVVISMIILLITDNKSIWEGN